MKDLQLVGTTIVLLLTLSLPIALPVFAIQTEPSLTVAVSVVPLAGIVEEVGSGYIETSILLTEGVEPHAFTVDPSIIAAVDSADLLVFTGHYHWEEDLANATTTPYITMDDVGALVNYESYGARLSPIPGEHDEVYNLAQHEEGNPHAWWLLPSNAVAIANATRAAFSSLSSENTDIWTMNFDSFIQDVDDFQDLVLQQDEVYEFSSMHAIVVFPAEAYVAEAFGIEVEAVLMEEGVTISGQELLRIQDAIRNGSVELIIGSDVAQLQSGGEIAYQLIEDYGGTLVWVKALFFSGFSDYISIMSYNLGSLTSSLEERGLGVASPTMLLLFGGLSGVLGLIVIIQMLVIVRRSRE